MIHRTALAMLASATALAPACAQQAALARDDALQMVSIDVEGGGGTLFVTPQGHSLLIDTGNPETSSATGNHPSSERIANAAHALGVRKIDYLITTHYHGDHIGGLEGLMARMPIGTFIDHGENREVRGTQGPAGIIGPDWRTIPPPGRAAVARAPATSTDPNVPPPGSTAAAYLGYLKLVGKHPHIVVKPGYKFSIDGLHILIVAADAKMIEKPLPGAGEANTLCADMVSMESNGGEENTRSTSSIITYGKVKIAAFGDLTWDREKDLFCPNDKVGKVDVYLASHHGTQWSGSPAMVDSLQPIVTIMGNAPNKGDDPDRVKTIQGSPRFQALWRLHNSRQHPEIDGPDDMVANLGPDQAADKDYNLRLRIRPNGSITVINERNGYNKTYKAGG